MKKCFDIKLFFLIALVAFDVSAQVAKKTSFGVLVDNTGSMRSQSTMQLELAKAVAKRASTVGAPVSIFGFVSSGSTATIAGGLECSTDTDLITKQIQAIGTVPGQTTLFEAIDVAAGRIKKPASPTCPQSDVYVLVLLSDGEDRASKMKADELFKALQQSGVKLYVVAMVDELATERGFTSKSARDKSESFLKRLASETSGRIVFPKKDESAREIVDRLFSEKSDK